MTERAIFNRKYTSFTPGSQQVWLTNGAGVTTTLPTTQQFTAGSSLIQGEVVYVSGTYVLPASAASGVSPDLYNAIGITTTAATVLSGVEVNLDDVAVVGAANITGESALVPGQYYFLSKYSGQLTRYSTASGTVSASGGYAASTTIGLALSASELQVEISSPLILYS